MGSTTRLMSATFQFYYTLKTHLSSFFVIFW